MSEGLQSALASGFLQSQDSLLKFEGQRALCGSSKAHLAKRTCLLNITTHIPKDTLKGSQKSTQSGATLSFKAQETSVPVWYTCFGSTAHQRCI